MSSKRARNGHRPVLTPKEGGVMQAELSVPVVSTEDAIEGDAGTVAVDPVVGNTTVESISDPTPSIPTGAVVATPQGSPSGDYWLEPGWIHPSSKPRTVDGLHPVHELAMFFPRMGAKEFDRLRTDIKWNGQLEPCLTIDGKIADGRHRDEACRDLGIETRLQEWDGKGNPLEMVVGLNAARRELSQSQKAATAVLLLPKIADEAAQRRRGGKEIPEGEIRGSSAELAGDMVGVRKSSVNDAKLLYERSRTWFEKVFTGELSIGRQEQGGSKRNC